jgi:hypothetical protein
LDLEGVFTPLFAPKFADKESNDDLEDIPFFYIVGSGSDEIPSNMILKAPASMCHHFIVLASKADVSRAGVAVDTCATPSQLRNSSVPCTLERRT